MVLFNYSTKEITAKIVYYGPGLCGKTTNLQFIYENLPGTINKGKMLSLATKTDRTLFFDFLPIDLGTIRGMRTRLQLYTVPGQVFYNTTRKLVLKGADGIIFVADSQRRMLAANIESYKNLEENLAEHDMNLSDIPLIIQFNKRDLPDVAGIEELNAALNKHNVPIYEAVAVTGIGVHETLKAMTRLVLNSLKERYADKREQRPEPAMHAVSTVVGGAPSAGPRQQAMPQSAAAAVPPPARPAAARPPAPPAHVSMPSGPAQPPPRGDAGHAFELGMATAPEELAPAGDLIDLDEIEGFDEAPEKAPGLVSSNDEIGAQSAPSPALAASTGELLESVEFLEEAEEDPLELVLDEETDAPLIADLGSMEEPALISMGEASEHSPAPPSSLLDQSGELLEVFHEDPAPTGEVDEAVFLPASDDPISLVSDMGSGERSSIDLGSEAEEDPLNLVEVEDEMGEVLVPEDRHDDHLSFLPTASVAASVPFEQDRSNLTLDTEPPVPMAPVAPMGVDGSTRTKVRIADVAGSPSGEHEIVLPLSLAIGDKRIQFKLMVRLDLTQEGASDSTLDDRGGSAT